MKRGSNASGKSEQGKSTIFLSIVQGKRKWEIGDFAKPSNDHDHPHSNSRIPQSRNERQYIFEYLTLDFGSSTQQLTIVLGKDIRPGEGARCSHKTCIPRRAATLVLQTFQAAQRMLIRSRRSAVAPLFSLLSTHRILLFSSSNFSRLARTLPPRLGPEMAEEHESSGWDVKSTRTRSRRRSTESTEWPRAASRVTVAERMTCARVPPNGATWFHWSLDGVKVHRGTTQMRRESSVTTSIQMILALFFPETETGVRDTSDTTTTTSNGRYVMR